VQWQIILTKADLLSIEDMAKCVLLIEDDLMSKFLTGSKRLWNTSKEAIQCNKDLQVQYSHQLVFPVSSNSGAGVTELWRELKQCAHETSRLPPKATSTVASLGSAEDSTMDDADLGDSDDDDDDDDDDESDRLEERSVISSVQDEQLDAVVVEREVDDSNLFKDAFQQRELQQQQQRVVDTRVREHVKATLLRREKLLSKVKKVQ
jgi:hypothetical protein